MAKQQCHKPINTIQVNRLTDRISYFYMHFRNCIRTYGTIKRPKWFKCERIRSCQIIRWNNCYCVCINTIYNGVFYSTHINIERIDRFCDIWKFGSIFSFGHKFFLKSNEFSKICSSQIELKTSLK